MPRPLIEVELTTGSSIGSPQSFGRTDEVLEQGMRAIPETRNCDLKPTPSKTRDDLQLDDLNQATIRR